MSHVPDITGALNEVLGKGDPFQHGAGEDIDEVFKGDETPFSRNFYREQADEARKRCEVDCACHLNPHDYVPVCPNHGLPLVAAEAGNGQCRWVGPPRKVHNWDAEATPQRCITWGPGSWDWKPRRMFNGDDLPPFNGFNPPKTPPWMEPRTWGFDDHDCPTCTAITRHAVGDDRMVCLICGLCRWTKDLPS